MKVDLDQAFLDPTTVFKDPMEVVNVEGISREDKLRILRRWEYDARELSVAEEENMASTNEVGSRILEQVLKAMMTLNAQPHEHVSSSTKQG